MISDFLGVVELKVTSADIGNALERLNEQNISAHNIRFYDELTARFSVSVKDSRRTITCLSDCGSKVVVENRRGAYFALKDLLARPVLALGIAIYILFVIYVPSRVFFVQVEGNKLVAERQILEAAKVCGIEFGANRREVRSEKVKNALLQEIPQLQWVGVNTYGCVAMITVRERDVEDKKTENGFKSIVASRDAIIRQITVIRGTQQCVPGQAVKAGQLLVSAYKDYGISLKLTGAEAAIMGQTAYEIEGIAPSVVSKRTKEVARETKYSLVIGKKQINFYKDSGISHNRCVKMYKKTNLVLPGGFVLPIALISQEIIHYDTAEYVLEDCSFLNDACRAYLESKIVDGSILQVAETTDTREEVSHYRGSFSCLENIVLKKDEELINNYE